MPGTADRGKDRPAERITTPSLDPSGLIDSNWRAMQAALDVQSHGFRRMAKIGNSMLDFVQRRLEHDAAFAQKLGTIKAPEDAYAAYHDFFDVAAREYSDEFSALAEICADQTRDAMHEMERQVGEVTRPVLAAE